MTGHIDSLRITTPEGVAVDLSLAGIGSRFMATMLDVAIQAATALIGAVVLAGLFEGGVLVLFASIGAFLILFVYDVTFELLNNGRTPGKQAAGLRVVSDDGTPVTFVASAIRNILRTVDFLPAFYGVAMLSIFLTRRHQRLGDLAAGTLVIRDRFPKPSHPGNGHVQLGDATSSGWDVSAVTAEDLVLVRAFLSRRPTLTAAARASLAADLALRMRSKVAGAPASSDEAFLERLAAGAGGRRR